MRIVHCGGNRMGSRVLEILTRHGDAVTSVIDLASLRAATVEPVDWLVSAGFRDIIPPDILSLAHTAINLHPSLLPWGRGANPNVWVLASGEPAGVTLHEMVAKVDAGSVYAQRAIDTTFADTGLTLYTRLEDAAVDLFADVWPQLRDGEIQPHAQLEGGSYHRVADMRALARIDLESSITWAEAFDVLRSLTFPPHRNIVIEREGRRYHVEIRIEDVTDEVAKLPR